MTHDEWIVLVMTSHKGLYKKGYLGREVHEFEINAAMMAQLAFTRCAGTEQICITGLRFTTPPEGSTYRSITEACHRKVSEEPDLMDSAWVNVWHTVVEASFLAYNATCATLDMADTVHETGFAAYLAYCRECRDWNPNPPQFFHLPPDQRAAWGVAQKVGVSMMASGFRRLKKTKRV